jgi:hypothetical protein
MLAQSHVPVVPAASTGAEIARRLFMDDPTLSIHDVARALDKEGCALGTDLITSIRREVRQKIDAAHHGDRKWPQPLIRRAPEVQIVNPLPKPRFNVTPVVPVPKPVEAKPLEAKAPPEPQQPTPPPLGEPTTEQKRNWLDDWLLEHPDASVPRARVALQTKFGSALSTTYIADRVKLIREAQKPEAAIHADSTPTPESVPRGAAVADLAHRMKALGVSKMEIVGDHYRIELAF